MPVNVQYLDVALFRYHNTFMKKYKQRIDRQLQNIFPNSFIVITTQSDGPKSFIAVDL